MIPLKTIETDEPVPEQDAPSSALPRITADYFLSTILHMLVAKLDAHEDKNFDMDYRPFGLALTADDYVQKRANYLDFVFRNHQGLFETLQLLNDAESRSLFMSLILFRILGHERVRLPSHTAGFWTAKRQAQAVPPQKSPFDTRHPGLCRFAMTVDGHTYIIDCLQANIFFSFFMRQYYLERKQVTIKPQPGDYVVDAGSCFGDTAIAFAHSVGREGRVHTFEILDAHLEILRHNIAQNGELKNIVIHPVALSDVRREGVLGTGRVNPGFSPQEFSGGERSCLLDDLVEEGKIERVDFIKMDIEGHELAALRGAEKTIRRFRPRLAISLYHRWEDYIDIPRYIAGLDLGYKMYLENYTLVDGETILYAAAQAPA